jgi:hypothetical protein
MQRPSAAPVIGAVAAPPTHTATGAPLRPLRLPRWVMQQSGAAPVIGVIAAPPTHAATGASLRPLHLPQPEASGWSAGPKKEQNYAVTF